MPWYVHWTIVEHTYTLTRRTDHFFREVSSGKPSDSTFFFCLSTQIAPSYLWGSHFFSVRTLTIVIRCSGGWEFDLLWALLIFCLSPEFNKHVVCTAVMVGEYIFTFCQKRPLFCFIFSSWWSFNLGLSLTCSVHWQLPESHAKP